VICENNGIATSLDLGSSNFKIPSLTGTIPPDVALLSSLKTLDLTHTGNHGEIPPELWYLTSLSRLALGNKNLTGSFPAEMERNWTNLVFLDLSHISVLDDNGDAGTIPSSVWSLTTLTHLDISGMGVVPSTIPRTVGQLSTLTEFKASSSDFIGTLPDEIGLWTNLEMFDISDNAMTGTIPSSIANWTRIKIALFNGNKFVGTFPDAFCYLSSLQEFNADCNPGGFDALQCSEDCRSKIDRKGS
jgi:Leucine-rich repeat (LRR) protein